MKRYWPIILIFTSLLQAENSTLGRIALFGNRITKNHVILQELEIHPGYPITHSLLISDRSWLIRLDFLNKIDFQLKPGRQKDQCDLLIVVKEKGRWSFMPSLHTNDLFGMYGGGSLKYRNLFGLRQNLIFKMEAGGKNKTDLIWSYPWFAGSARLFTNLSYFYYHMPYPYKDYHVQFTQKSQGVKIQLGRRMNRTFQIGFQGQYEFAKIDISETTLSGEKSDRFFTAGYFLNWDTRDWPSYPRRGQYILVGVDYTWVKHDNPFQFIYLNIKKYYPKKRSDILAVQYLFQGYHGTIPVYKRLHLGGGESVRGIPTGFFAGDLLAMMNVEYRFPIMYERNFEENLHVGYAGVIFFDIGTAWFAKDKWTANRVRSSVGIGIHALWDNYVIRGEYGTRGKGWGFINIGTSAHF